MTYLHKLASRISRLRTTLPILMLSAVACTKGEKVEFLGPNPNTPVPTVQSLRIEPKVGSALVGTNLKFTAIGYSATGFPLPVTIDWVAEGGTISATGDYTAVTAGQFKVTAQVRGNASVTDSASVVAWNSPLDQIALIVSPDSALLTAGDSLDFSAAVLMVNGTAGATGDVTWSADGGTISPSGMFKAGQGGTYTISAVTANGLRGFAQVFVGAAARILEGITINPGSSTVAPGAAATFTATGDFSDGTSGAANVGWSATGGAINSNGVYTAGSQAGNYYVIARNAQGTVADTAAVTITGLTVVGLSISPKTVSLQPSASVTFSGQARLSDGSFTTANVSYQATGGAIGSNGAYIAGSTPGSYLAIITAPGVSGADTATITIAHPVATLTGILLNPATASLSIGQTRQFAVTGVWSDGTNLSPAVSWTATGGQVTPSGLYTAGSAPGTFQVVATTASGKADTSQVTVLPAVLSSLSLTPATGSLTVGQTLQLSVSGTWSDGSTSTPAVTWGATGGTVSGSGLFSAGSAAGTYRVIATQQGGTRADTSLITISLSAPTLTSVVLSPASVVLAQGGVRQFTAIGSWSDGSISTPSLTWTATGGTITGTGLYTAGSTAGTFRVIASGGGKADTAAVTLTAAGPIVTSFVMTPGTASVPAGGQLQFQSAIVWSDGVNHPATVSHSTTGGTISMNGLFVAGSLAGTFGVIATCSCGVADTSSVVISAATVPVLTSLQLTPAAFTLAPGAGQQLGISYTWSNGSTTPPPVDYSATGGTVSSLGLYTAPASTGNYQVVVSHTGGTRKDTSFVTVTGGAAPPPPPPPASGMYPNRPSHYTRVVADVNFSQNVPSGSGYQTIVGAGGVQVQQTSNWSKITDPTATGSASDVWKVYMSPGAFGGGIIGAGDGHGYGNLYWRDTDSIQEEYLSIRIKFPVGYNWHPISNKFLWWTPGQILVQLNEGGKWLSTEVLDPAGDLSVPDIHLNPINNSPITTGVWHHIEVHIIRGLNGTLRVWMDGVLRSESTNIRIPTVPSYREFYVTPFRGGGGETLAVGQEWLIDHIYRAAP